MRCKREEMIIYKRKRPMHRTTEREGKLRYGVRGLSYSVSLNPLLCANDGTPGPYGTHGDVSTCNAAPPGPVETPCCAESFSLSTGMAIPPSMTVPLGVVARLLGAAPSRIPRP